MFRRSDAIPDNMENFEINVFNDEIDFMTNEILKKILKPK